MVRLVADLTGQIRGMGRGFVRTCGSRIWPGPLLFSAEWSGFLGRRAGFRAWFVLGWFDGRQPRNRAMDSGPQERDGQRPRMALRKFTILVFELDHGPGIPHAWIFRDRDPLCRD